MTSDSGHHEDILKSMFPFNAGRKQSVLMTFSEKVSSVNLNLLVVKTFNNVLYVHINYVIKFDELQLFFINQ